MTVVTTARSGGGALAGQLLRHLSATGVLDANRRPAGVDRRHRGAHAGTVGTDDQRRAIVTQVAAQLRDLAEILRAERARLAAAGTDTDRLDQVLTELEPIVVGIHDAEISGAVAQVLERHGPGPWPDSDLAALAGVDVTELRRMRDQIAAGGLARPVDDQAE